MIACKPPSLRRLLGPLVLAPMLAVLGGTATAAAGPSPWWLMNTSSAPTNLPPGGEGEIFVTAVNGGDAEANGSVNEIVLTDTMPPNTTVTEYIAAAGPGKEFGPHKITPLTCKVALPKVSCPYTGKLLPSESVRLRLFVQNSEPAGTVQSVTNTAEIEGGEAPRSSLAQALKESGEPTLFGVERYELRPENEGGSLDTQAGSHPFQLTTTFNTTHTVEPHSFFGGKIVKSESVPALAKDLHFVLPPGLLGNATALPQCSGADFAALAEGGFNYCPGDTAVGVATVTINEPNFLGVFSAAVPVFNLVPSPGEPARFGFEIHDVPVVLSTAVRSGRDYAVEASVHYATQAAQLLGSQVTFWGVPEDPRHDAERGWECLGGGVWVGGVDPERPCVHLQATQPTSFLTLPTSCEGLPASTVTGESWPHKPLDAAEREAAAREGVTQISEHLEYRYSLPSGFDGCNLLGFDPTLSVETESHSSSTPTGLIVKVHLPQESTVSANGLAQADIRETTVALPQGVQASSGAADGLLTCDGEEFGFDGRTLGLPESAQTENDHFDAAVVSCPDAAKIGTVRIKTPLLENELTGFVYLASEDTDPFGSPLVLYLFAEDKVSGVKVKLAGDVSIDQSTGQLISTFKQTPPVPFEDLTLTLFGGPRASQSTPEACGTYTATASFEPWSGGAPVPSRSLFAIDSGPGGAPCAPAGTQPFSPSLQAGSVSNRAGAFSPFTVTIDRPDGSQALKTITVHLEPGGAAMLASVTPCPEPQAAEARCGPESLVGHSTALAGLGTDPVSIPGEVYLTGPYRGAPFGLLTVTHAEHVGPFDLGDIPVRSTIAIDPTTAAATVTSDPLPQLVKGVPAQIKRLNVSVDRAGFSFNPTNCGKLEVKGTLTGYGPGGADAGREVSTPYQAADCTALPFKPTIAVSTEGDVSRLDGTGLRILVTSGSGQTNIQKTKLVFPASLPSRLSTIQQACPEKTFAANPSSCPEGSVIGTGTAHTPVLRNALTGPAYLVSHGGAAFPDAEFVLQGEGITLVLDGQTNIHDGITSSTFNAVPDAPVSTFEVSLPRGPHSAFSGYGNLCAKHLTVPTTFGGQNGALMQADTKVTVRNCANALIKAQSKLAKALKACHKDKSKHKRSACEATARKRYGHSAKRPKQRAKRR